MGALTRFAALTVLAGCASYDHIDTLRCDQTEKDCQKAIAAQERRERREEEEARLACPPGRIGIKRGETFFCISDMDYERYMRSISNRNW